MFRVLGVYNFGFTTNFYETDISSFFALTRKNTFEITKNIYICNNKKGMYLVHEKIVCSKKLRLFWDLS